MSYKKITTIYLFFESKLSEIEFRGDTGTWI